MNAMMEDVIVNTRRSGGFLVRQIWKNHRVWLVTATIIALVSLFDPPQMLASVGFVIRSLVSTSPYLLLSIALAAYAGASGADNMIARAFAGSPLLMIAIAAAFGGLSPFCSCGVIPLIAALLAMGVPLSAVMAFWLASPVIDPSMFVLTAGILGWEFAVAKTLAATGLGLFGGYSTLALTKGGAFANPMRKNVGSGGCGAARVSDPKPVVWAFWHDRARRKTFARETIATTLFLAKWLTLAFLLESLMIAFVPGEWIASAVGTGGFGSIALSALVGVPAYLNGYAATPLVSGLLQQGMTPGAGLAFLVAGGVTSVPAAIAVWALVRKPVFALYIALSLSGSMLAGMLFQLWSA